MAEFVVTAMEVKNKATELRKLNAEYKKAAEDLATEESRLNTMWEGDAHDNFDVKFKKDQVNVQNLYAAVEQYCVKLEEIAVNYANAEIKNAAIAAGEG